MCEQLGDASAVALCDVLKDNKTMHTLNIFKNGITDEGAKALGEMLKENDALTSLNLAYNQIKDEGMAAITDGLRTNKTLKNLQLRANDQSKESSTALLTALKEENDTLEKLIIAGCWMEEGEGVDALLKALGEKGLEVSTDKRKLEESWDMEDLFE